MIVVLFDRARVTRRDPTEWNIPTVYTMSREMPTAG